MINLLYIDLFCGAGGTSTGVNSAEVDGEHCAKVIACVNHDANAIASHAANHPEAMHFTEDIRTLELSPLVRHIERCRIENPEALVVLWASLECTNFSKAKGGLPRDADSRTLAEHLFRYIEAINPDYIQIENVEDFMSGGPLDENGKPESRDKGRDYLRWIKKVSGYGYCFEHRILNAADYGARTTRKRFFGIFAKYGLPIVFPQPTHCKKSIPGLFSPLKPWNAVRDVLDFSDEGKSIFDRKKSLAEKTLERIYAGLIKFVAGGKDAFLVKYNSMSRKGKYVPPSLDEPCPTVATQGRLAIASVSFLSKQFGGSPEGKNISIDEPAGAITCRDHHAFISVHYGHGYNHSVNVPAATLTTKDRMALIQTHFLDMQYGNGTPSSVDSSAPALTTNPKHKLVTVKPWLMDTGFDNVGRGIDEPAPTITANRKWHYLVNPQFASVGSSVEYPCFTLIARMDKRPPSFVTVAGGIPVIEIYSTDSPMTVKIKEFMAMYWIEDISMRMLRIDELTLIQGFPADYILIGTQAEQKKFLGNAVEVTIARKLCEALCLELREFMGQKQAI